MVAHQTSSARPMVTAGKYVLLEITDGEWSVAGPRFDQRFDRLLDAMNAIDLQVTATTRIDYHDSLEELMDELDLNDLGLLFPKSPDGWWNVATYGSSLWVPSSARDNHEDVFEEIGVYGKHGYFVRLYQWEGSYLFNYDNGWEAGNAGWEAIGKVSSKRAIAEARAYANALWKASGLTAADLAEYEEDF